MSAFQPTKIEHGKKALKERKFRQSLVHCVGIGAGAIEVVRIVYNLAKFGVHFETWLYLYIELVYTNKI